MPLTLADKLAGALRAILNGGGAPAEAAARSLLTEYATHAAPDVISIRAQDQLRNVAFVTIRAGRVSCTLAHGVPASLTYAGVPTEMEAEMRLRLETADAAKALSLLQGVGRKGFEYSIFAAR
ncbi:hypothetical protein [Stenotrophomonas oahuensis]|uniref:Uncharacterized protein n=1 Tax=Stenotrophomonas oahuensis TaxID=3003271 RepID=A0ABY9YWK0_9GAMM|nr:hypothetical protein [Stenotrophomonas sp. A5586]WNH54830.1 hypothetical protein PDM29_20670 [Stenotrophomonas sp. A5586]